MFEELLQYYIFQQSLIDVQTEPVELFDLCRATMDL